MLFPLPTTTGREIGFTCRRGRGEKWKHSISLMKSDEVSGNENDEGEERRTLQKKGEGGGRGGEQATRVGRPNKQK